MLAQSLFKHEKAPNGGKSTIIPATCTNTVVFPSEPPLARLPSRGHRPAEASKRVSALWHLPASPEWRCNPLWGPDWPTGPSPCLAQKPPSVVGLAAQRCLSGTLDPQPTQACTWPLSAVLWKDLAPCDRRSRLGLQW